VNIADARTYGAEVLLVYTVTDALRFRGGYSLLCHRIDIPAGYYTGDLDRAPRHQATLGVQWDPVASVNVDLQARYVEDSTAVPGYFTVDLRIAWHPTDRLELALVGQNLLDPQHLEQAPEVFTQANEVPRSVHGKVTWHF
jgi:iron complex outermembrane receptor protein